MQGVVLPRAVQQRKVVRCDNAKCGVQFAVGASAAGCLGVQYRTGQSGESWVPYSLESSVLTLFVTTITVYIQTSPAACVVLPSHMAYGILTEIYSMRLAIAHLADPLI